ncbi:MAG TPA: hypothetical protein VGL72_23710 [Bryobacteraceae bacterium]|jgi:tetratricopeptide (TPR) repeat protein
MDVYDPTTMRLFAIFLSLSLTIAASRAIKYPPLPAISNSLDPEKQIATAKSALRRDIGNPYLWSTLAAAYRSANKPAEANESYHRAVDLSGAVPQPLVDAARFYFERQDFDQALPLAARILDTVSDYDSVLFTYLDHLLLPNPAPVFIAIGLNRRPIRAYTQHLIDIGDMKSARLGWRFAESAHFADNRLVSSYLDAMILRAQRYEEAQHDWVEYLGAAKGDYPESNLLFNAGFEREPTGSPMDWRINPSDSFDTSRDDSVAYTGKCSLRIHFTGTENAAYNHLAQSTCVRPGPHFLQARVRTDHITTDEGPRLEIVDAELPSRLDVRTEPVTGNNDWRLVVQPFVVPNGTRFITVRVIRTPSRQADDKIAGTYWLDEVRLGRE